MANKKFKPSHLFLGITGLLIIEDALFRLFPGVTANEGFILVFAIIGTVMNIYVAIQAIEQVKIRLHILAFLWLIVLEFILFFSFEYWYLLMVQPGSFATLTPNLLNILLHSTMVFVFNPIYLPATAAGRALLLINTLGSLGLVLFILQNIWQLRLDTTKNI